MAFLYGPNYVRIWSEALLLPGQTDLWESLSFELASYFQLDHEEAKRSAEQTWMRRGKLSASGMSQRDVTGYYESQQHGIQTGMYWHSLRPDNWALVSVAALHAAQRFAGGCRLLEFGHGVGSTGILLARHGFDVALYDISDHMSSFARWRFGHRALPADFLVGEDSLKQTGQYDVIVSLDVFEHLEEPLRMMKLLVSHLTPGGVLVLNIAFGVDPENPEHLLPRRLGLLDRLRGLGLQRATLDSPLVFYRSPAAAPRPLIRAVDTAFAAWEDARHNRLRLLAAAVRRLRAFEAPPAMPAVSRAALHLDGDSHTGPDH